jgi:hypothetical protein
VIELARDTLNPELELLGVLLNLADMRTVHSREALASLREQLGDKVLETVVGGTLGAAAKAGRGGWWHDPPPPRGGAAQGGGAGDARARLGTLR